MNRYTRPLTLIPAHEIARSAHDLFVTVYRNVDGDYQPGTTWHNRRDAEGAVRTAAGLGGNKPSVRFRIIPRGCFA